MEITLRPGQTLWDIARQVYGDGRMWRRIAAANKIDNPRKLRRGRLIRIPDMPGRAPLGPPVPTARPGGSPESSEFTLADTWPARLGKAALGAMFLPGDVYAGRVDPMSEEGLDRAADLAAAMTGVPGGLCGLGVGARLSAAGRLRAAA